MMWALLSKRTQLILASSTVLVCAFGLEMLVQFFTGQSIHLIKLISAVATAVLLVLVPAAYFLFRQILKRWPILQKLTFPDLNGAWEGYLTTTWVDPETGNNPEPIPATVRINQTLFGIHVSLETDESVSDSAQEVLETDRKAGKYRVWYRYDNSPKAAVRHRSPNHGGLAFLEMHWEKDSNLLTGRYFTDRKTTGDITLRRVPDMVG
ncbi:hypothetical protein J7444_06265 [Labrenzia sp. R4_1]|uniref:Cap15 family cyclic dinucleotide receptor domain-containing protein n=1 Tax=Labrenzia sp. R4_1 TaxID=2821106 RepID=UPI001ADC0E80|nr:hypothetical protein [Labrenzia sp. R4_1]MBO9424316.1 hypothetical protein [Labrenzia sp. R4_1]